MKRDKIIYWTATGILTGVMLWSALNFAFNAAMQGAFAHLGLPPWFRAELTTAKILGSIALLIPIVPFKLKEFAYFGFALTLISAPIAHLSSGDSVWLAVGHFTFLSIWAVSYFYFQKIARAK